MKPLDCLVLLTLPLTRIVKARTIHKNPFKSNSSLRASIQHRLSPLTALEPEICNSGFSLTKITEALLVGWCSYESFSYLQVWLHSHSGNELLWFKDTVSTWEWTHSIFIFSFPSKLKKLTEHLLLLVLDYQAPQVSPFCIYDQHVTRNSS